MATFLLITIASKKAKFILYPKTIALITNFLLFKHMLYIHYLVQLKKDQIKIYILIDFGSNINTITRAYIAQLSFKI